MKKIKSLMELDFSPLLSVEAISTKGGGEWTYAAGNWSYMFDEVTVTPEKPPFDVTKDVPALQDPNYREWVDGNPAIGPVMEYVAIAVAYVGYLTR